jgi:4-hydroxy-3-methylbut-2-enyl diphosphate reductase
LFYFFFHSAEHPVCGLFQGPFHGDPGSLRVSAASELRREWFRPDDRVGVCGATSTPKWLLEEVSAAIKNLQ